MKPIGRSVFNLQTYSLTTYKNIDDNAFSEIFSTFNAMYLYVEYYYGFRTTDIWKI